MLSTIQSFDTGVIQLKMITILGIEKSIISKYVKIKKLVRFVQLNGMQCSHLTTLVICQE